jgi:protein-S-isoprenylcysteine O-methyltransferase Ste14
MNGTSDIGQSESYENEGGLDPRGAARLLVQTQRQAQRGLDFRSPWLSLLAAAVVLVAFGAVWLSVRGQHPYKGPTAVALVVLYAVVLIRIGTVVYAHRRARAGVSGRSVSQQRAEGAALAVALVAVYVLMGALAHAGASDSVVYGVYVVTATLIVLGAFWGARSAVREDWPGLGMSIAFMLVAAGSAFAGPRGVWLSDGVGCCVVLLGYSAAQAWLLRASRSDA